VEDEKWAVVSSKMLPNLNASFEENFRPLA
jgi:hypothetical protein